MKKDILLDEYAKSDNANLSINTSKSESSLYIILQKTITFFILLPLDKTIN